MQTLRRTAQLVKAQCSDVTRKGKPQKLHRLSKVLNSAASVAGVQIAAWHEREQSHLYRQPVKTGSTFKHKYW